MSGTFSVIRFSPSTAALLSVAQIAFFGLVLSGCRSLSPQYSTPAPVPIPPDVRVPKTDVPDHYSAFRPILPGQSVPPYIVPPPIESARDTADQAKIDELNQRISELESQLEEARKAPPPVVVESPSLQEYPGEVKAAMSLPIINREGVKVSSDDTQDVRIAVMDQSLFLPNVWQLSPEGEETLRTIAAEIRASNSEAVLDIEGHTDSLMGDPNNPTQKHDISSVKTMVVMNFFMNSLCWDATRIRTSSFGRSRPVADNGTPEGRAKNNRIEIVIRNEEAVPPQEFSDFDE
ncbi:MAG: OmpA family protein [Planctomycetaceae bacterium]|jgi:flagellar motor protein MotB|nr:OmpA family protein [Planctomycetaceae bacterium]